MSADAKVITLRPPTRDLDQVVAEIRALAVKLARLEVEAREAVRKLHEHEARGYSHIRVRVLHGLRDALADLDGNGGGAA